MPAVLRSAAPNRYARRMKVQWHSTDPATGETRFFKAELFGGYWDFRRRMTRRSDWKKVHPTRVMWQEVLDFLERAEARWLSSEDQIRAVKKIIGELPPEPVAKDAEAGEAGEGEAAPRRPKSPDKRLLDDD